MAWVIFLWFLVAEVDGLWFLEFLRWFLVAEVDGLWFLEFLRWFLVVFGGGVVILLVKNFAISGKVATFVTANEGYASWLKC